MKNRVSDTHHTREARSVPEERFRMLDAAGRTVSGSEDLEAALLAAAGQALPLLGTWCFVDVVDEDDTMRRLGIVHAEIDEEDLPEPLLSDWGPRPGDPFGAGRVATTEGAEIVSYVSGESLRKAAHSAEVEEAFATLGAGSTLSAPLVTGGRVTGAVTFVSADPERYDRKDLFAAEALARIAALALENARLGRAAEESRRSMDSALAENIELNRRLVEINERLLVSAVREHEEAATAKQLQEESDALFRIIFDQAAMGIVVMDCDGNVVDSNPALREMLGYSRCELRGMHFTEFAKGSEAEGERTHFRELVSGVRTSFRIEKQCRRGDGGTVWASSVTSLGRSASGLSFAIALMEDITDRKRMEDELRHSQRMEAIGRLAGGIAHDFNNILMAVGGRAEVAIEGLDALHPVRADLEEIQAGLDRAATLTRQLLAFGRKQVLQPRTLDMGALLEGMERMLAPLLSPVRLSASIAHDIGGVRADPVQIEQIIMNLAVNARDAMPDGGEIKIELRREEIEGERATMLDDAVAPGHYVLLSVSDTGTGIEPEALPLILEPFFTTKDVGEGTGLGLSTAYGIIKQSDGFLDVESEVGVGTRFDIYMPEIRDEPEENSAESDPVQEEGAEEEKRGAGPHARGGVADTSRPAGPHARGEPGREERSPGRPVPPGASADGRGETSEWSRTPSILVVDDEDSIRALVARILEREGYRVFSAASSGDALELFRELEPAVEVDLIVSDVMMPDIPGPELVRRLRRVNPALRTVFISGQDETAIEDHDLGEAGRFLQKPFTAETLVGKVREVLSLPPRG